MLNVKYLFPGPHSTQPMTVDICGKAAIGSTGAVGTTTGKGATLTRTGTGAYTLTYATGAVPAILHADIRVIEASSTTRYVKILTATTTLVTFETSTTAGTPADMPSGSAISWRLCILNTSATR